LHRAREDRPGADRPNVLRQPRGQVAARFVLGVNVPGVEVPVAGEPVNLR
jgi:hypothetical protein